MTKCNVMQVYTEYYSRLKAKGVRLIKFDCPKCAKEIETVPAPAGEKWDSMSQCPHCESLFKKFTIGSRAYGLNLASRDDNFSL